jgi:hypothetical protein
MTGPPHTLLPEWIRRFALLGIAIVNREVITSAFALDE